MTERCVYWIVDGVREAAQCHVLREYAWPPDTVGYLALAVAVLLAIGVYRTYWGKQ